MIRFARGADVSEVSRLADLCDRPVPDSPLLLAESDGTLIAAVSTSTGDVIRDPFVASEDVVALLQLRATQLDRAA